MKIVLKSIAIISLLIVYGELALCQIPTRIISGKVMINDGSLIPKQEKYALITDSLKKQLEANPNDTTSLFYRALLLDCFNEQLAKPAPTEKGALENLQRAANLIDKAISLKMQDFKLKVLRAQVYKDLAYRFGGDESYKFTVKQINERRVLFNTYKEKANKLYNELAEIDKDNAYDYQKLKVNYDYPIKP
ncbi:hypothetical protein SNE26_23965 [Mucilaginibacter sp. cycad4]|uniref:hypothetical protein n=1 Tax=Mucilaginibacter sp. cycad4 TaxID=3342096 RepID=UPI002AAC391E|nr:hypothetical protein [Mucilaginibacter gossypii]WPU99073.1 hypothetical protein SNE26_23965 [Mucilaginibacter gossypii]